MSALTYKVGGDTKGLGRALGRAKGMIGSFARGAAKLGKAGLFAGVAASVAGIAVGIKGLKDALNLGGRFSDIAANTGLAAGHALILERAFKDSGIAGSKLQPTIGKMQKSIVEANDGLMTYKRAFEAIGLSVSDLMGMNPGKQFEIIQSALSAVQDPAERSARAMQIFGRSGAELGALFRNGNAIGNARESVGGAAAILEKNADSFDRSADLLAGIGDKLRGFFVGMASFVNPVLLPVLEEMNKIDLSQMGARVGHAIAMLAEAFRQDALPGMMGDGLMLAGKSLINMLVKGFRGLVSGLVEGFKNLPEIVIASLELITNAKLWSGLGDVLKGLGKSMATAFTALIPQAFGGDSAALTRAKAENARLHFQRGNRKIDSALNDGFRQEMEVVGTMMAKKFRNEMDKEGPIDTSGETSRLGATMERLRESLKAKTEEEKEVSKEVAPGVRDAEGFALKGVRPIISSLGRVGGGGLGSVLRDSMDKRRNELLLAIERNTRQPLSPAAAVYA